MTKAQTDETGVRSLDPKHAPVTLPAGSFDLDKLANGLGKAIDGTADHREANVEKALVGALGGDADEAKTRLQPSDPSSQPGFTVVPTEHPTLAGVVENRRVFDPASVKEAKPREQASARSKPKRKPRATPDAKHPAAAQANEAPAADAATPIVSVDETAADKGE